MVQKDLQAAEDNLLAVKGELTARDMMERFANKVRKEARRPADEPTTTTLRHLQEYRMSPTAQVMQSIVAKCFSRDVSFSSQYLVQLYQLLSGHFHYSSWTGPGIQLSPKLNPAQKCVLLTYAKRVENRDVSMADVEPEEETASEPGDT